LPLICGLAVLLGALSGCQALAGPYLAIRTPGHLDILESSPPEILVQAWRGTGIVMVYRDGYVPVGDDAARDPFDPLLWRIPVADPIPVGVHYLWASRSQTRDDIVFAISDDPFALAFVPDVGLGWVEPGSRHRTGLAILGPGGVSPTDVRLSIADPAGLILESDPPDLLPRSGQGDPVATRKTIPIDVRIPLRAATGPHYVRVQADGPDGTEREDALLVVSVSPEGAGARPEASPFEAQAATYRVASTLVGQGGTGAEGRARSRWRITFGCPDDRCDADVRGGGPRGDLAFVARYRAGTESFQFKGGEDLPRSDCRQLFSGTIEPVERDARGLAEFTYRLVYKLGCGRRTTTLQTWEGTGRRQ
jgi:hypothetical protein